MEAVNNRNSGPEVSDILRRHQKAFVAKNRLCVDQLKAYEDIIGCRTSKMGSHTLVCDNCENRKTCYNSCRNRHCPKCQYVKQVIWVEKLKARLLPVRYFHIVFTVPEFLNDIFYTNQRECYNMLFSSSAEAVKKAASNPAFLGAETGCLSVLHTWGQSLNYHPHIHMLVPAGGLDADGMEWVKANRKFFVPVKALSKIFRGIFMEKLRKAIGEGSLNVPVNRSALYANLTELNNRAYEKLWNVHIKKTFRGAHQVVGYLGRYTHRVAISNSRILDTDDRTVRFRWKDYRDNRNKVMELPCVEFIRRFMQHILPNGFYKIRYFGILAPANSRTKMNDCHCLLNQKREVFSYEGLSTYEVLRELLDEKSFRCPCCKNGTMVFGTPLPDEGIP
jgi:hypothetical protein